MRIREKIIEGLLFLCSAITVLTTFGILFVLLSESIKFFSEVSIIDFLTDKEWTPLFADKQFGIMSLVSGTLLTTFIAILVALPLGLTIAVRSEEHTSELQSLMRISYAVFCLKKKKITHCTCYK